MEADKFDPEDPADEALDRLLAQARWERPSVASTQRLRRRWVGISRRDVIVRIGWTLAAAAGVAIVAGSCALWLRTQTEPRIRPPIFMSVYTEPQVTQKPPPPVVVVVGKPLTLQLKLAMLVADHPQPPRAPAEPGDPPPQAAPQRDLTQLLVDSRSPSPQRRRGALCEMLSGGDTASVAAFLTCWRDATLHADAREALHALPARPVDALLAQLDSPLVDNRAAAAEALGEVCDAALASRLALMVASNTNRREALAALLSARTAAAAQSLAQAGAQSATVHAQIQALRSERSEHSELY
jgi:hypothetical protein